MTQTSSGYCRLLFSTAKAQFVIGMRLTKAEMEADCLDTAGNSLIASMLFDDSDEDNSDNDNDYGHNTDDCDTFELLALYYLSRSS